jgi:hypothetical protein
MLAHRRKKAIETLLQELGNPVLEIYPMGGITTPWMKPRHEADT